MQNKKVLVLGMKSSGISVCNLLNAMQMKVVFHDDNVAPVSDYENVTNKPISEVFENLSFVTVSPGVASSHRIIQEAIARGIPIYSELEIGTSQLKCKQIAVTGTNGKTTTVCMLEKVLSACGFSVKKMGNVGFPVSQVVLNNSQLDYAIIEASSFQLEYIATFKPYVAVITNIANDHLDRYKSFSDYKNAKKRILSYQNSDDYVFVNADNEIAYSLVSDANAKIMPFGLSVKNSRVAVKDGYFVFDESTLCSTKESRAKGEHNKYNLLCAMNVAALLGARREHLINLVRDFAPLSHRIEYVATVAGKSYYNDSKGTNIHATKVAINSVGDDIGLIMGGSDKNEEYCEFFDSLSDKVKHVSIFGDNAFKIYGSAIKMGYYNVEICNSLKECVESLASDSSVKTVLFSPAAASYDRYSDYAARGEAFKKLVYEIKT